MTPEEKARAARQYMNDPLFMMLMEELKRDAYFEWSGTAPTDTETREIAFHKHTALDQLVSEVEILAG